VKKTHRIYKLEDPMEEVEFEFDDSNNNLNFNKSNSHNLDFHMMKRNTVVLQNLKGLDINKIVNMVVENNKKPGGRFKNGKNNLNAIEELYEERSDSENSIDSEESRITQIRQTLTKMNNIEELKELIKELQLKNDELQKSLDNTNFKLLKKESEIEEKAIKAEKNKNQRAALQILKTKNEKILKDKDNEIIELKRQLQEKGGKSSGKAKRR
jgi:chromosome segregation ATPase